MEVIKLVAFVLMFLQCAKHRSQNAKKVWVWHACTQVLLVVTVILSSFATQMPRDAVASTAHTRCHVVSETSWCRTPPLLAGLVFPIACLSRFLASKTASGIVRWEDLTHFFSILQDGFLLWGLLKNTSYCLSVEGLYIVIKSYA